MGDVWKWGATSAATAGAPRATSTTTGAACTKSTRENGHEKYAGPGHWNDPDMLVVGYVGCGNPHPSHLKPERADPPHLHVVPALRAAAHRLRPDPAGPLHPGAALQRRGAGGGPGPAGQAGRPGAPNGTPGVGPAPGWTAPTPWAWSTAAPTRDGDRPLVRPRRHRPQPVRDLWLHKNVGTFADRYSVEVPAHGCVLLKIGRAR